MSGLYKDPKLSLEPVVVLTSLQLKQHASHLSEGQELTDKGLKGNASTSRVIIPACRENRQSCFQVYNPSSPLVNLIRKRDSAVSKMSGNVNVVTSPQHRRKSLMTAQTKNPGQSIKTYIKGGPRSMSPGRSHKCSQCQERFHTSTLLAAHKRIHDQETDDEDTDIDVEVGVEETDHIIENALNDLSSSDSTSEPQNYNNDDSNTRLAFNTKQGKSTNSSDRTVGNFTLRGSSVAYSQRNKCLECPATFSEEWYLQLHMILLHFINKNSISCPGCSANCETEQRLRQHIQSHHGADLQLMNYDISRSLGLSVDSLTGERLKPGETRRKPQRISVSAISAIRKDVSRAISKACDETQPVISLTANLVDPVSSAIKHTKPVQAVTSTTLNFGQRKQAQSTPKLLNVGVMKRAELAQPMTSATLNSRQKAQVRPGVTVSPKLVSVLSKLTKQLQPVLSISGKSVGQLQHVNGPSPKLSAHPFVTAVLPSSISCNWRKASPSQKDLIIDLVEAEMKYIVTDRSKLGDHFSYSDIQRLSLQVCDSLKISKFFDGSPPKRWAQRVLAKVRQVPRPGRFRFVHNFNVSYVNAAFELCAKGLTERDIFYVFEARLWEVSNGKVYLNPSLKTHQGAIIPDESLEQSMGVLLSFNAEGSRFLQPYLIYQGKPVEACNLHSITTRSSRNMSKELVECDYFCLWLSQFLQVIHERPILLLVEGDVTHLSYSLIKLARENNVHILFLPSKKRFVHSHRLIMESVLFPYVKAFDKEMEKYMKTHPSNHGILLNEFGNRNDEALMNALQNVQIRRAFVQAGFLPLPPSVQVLEDATQDYLRGVDIPILEDQNTQTPHSPVASYHSTPSLPSSPLLSEVKEEPVEFQLENVKQETVEEDIRNLEIKQEPMECPQDDFIHDVNAPQFETIKVQVEDESDLCPTCGDMLSSIQSFTDHQCKKDWNMEQDPLTTQAPFICGDCGSGFNEKHLLRNHSCHFVDNEEVFTCPLCDSQFFDETALLKHRCHLFSSLSNECELFTCHLCGMSFALKDTLDFHLSMHDESQCRHHQTPVTNSSLRQTTAQNELRQQLAPLSTLEDGRDCFLSSENSKSSSKLCENPPYVQRKKQARMDSPSSCTSSRTMSPAFSDSSRTLTASPCTLSSSSSDQTFKKGGELEAEPSKPGGARRTKLPPPPLPEHDYLGQIYPRRSIKSVQAVIINSNSSSIFRIDAQNERPVKVNCLSIATKIRKCAKDSTPNQQTHPLSRKRTKKVQKRRRRLIALIQRK